MDSTYELIKQINVLLTNSERDEKIRAICQKIVENEKLSDSSIQMFKTMVQERNSELDEVYRKLHKVEAKLQDYQETK